MLLSRLRQALQEFRSASAGNVAITFGLAFLPIICGVGAAVDYSRANSVKVKLQAAIDSTALMLSKEAATDTSDQLQANASKYFLAMFNPPGVQNTTISATYSSSGGTSLVIDGSTLASTTLMHVFGIDTIKVGSTSTVKWGSTRLRVAMALDNTKSMQQSGKMDALKSAATNFLSQMQSAATTNGDVYVSIIPFSTSVNVGATNYTQSWLTWTDYGKCNGASGWGYDDYTHALCDARGGHWSAYAASKQQYWTGCVADRGGTNGPTGSNYDTNVDTPNIGDPATLFPAVDYSDCPQQALGLSYDWSTMSSLINSMSPNGYTNQNIGLALGWMSLVGGGPFTVPATSPGYDYEKIIILFTDGLNTENRWYTDQSSIDDRETMTCDNIKAAGITLYTVQISTDGTAPSSLLQNCASDSSKFFYLTSSSQLVTTFNQIGISLSNLRIAK
ncbi:MAG: pilus assembly protein [Pseudolabrys sp.]